MPRIAINELKLFYAARGLDRRPLLLLIHGAGGSHLDWPPQLRQFDPLGSCAVDLPGHGRSSAPARGEIGAYADDLLALIKKLALTDVVLVGHSMGGAIALDIALRQVKQIVGLILISSGARLRVNKELMQLVGVDHSAAIDRIAAAAWGSNAPPDLVQQTSQLMLNCDPEAVRLDFTACDEFDVVSRLGSITLPTLVMVGTEDRMTPLKYNRQLAERVANAEFISIDGAGHMLAMERPNAVGDAIREFVNRRIVNL